MFTDKKVIVFDVDDTILTTENRDYKNSKPINEVINGMRELKSEGWRIVLHTSRGMGRGKGSVKGIEEEVRKEINDFCEKHSVPHDEIIIGKTWATTYVDDKALRPDEFVNHYRSLIKDAQ
jgi:capsule biosynthesis phosphatase